MVMLPRRLVSDMDHAFINSIWRKLFKLRMSTFYHPKMDGQNEVLNLSLEQYLEFVHHQPSLWFNFLPLVEWKRSSLYEF